MPDSVGLVTCKSRLGVVRRRREWMMIGRREASLVTSAMSGSAITGTCMVACYWGSRGRRGRDNGRE